MTTDPVAASARIRRSAAGRVILLVGIIGAALGLLLYRLVPGLLVFFKMPFAPFAGSLTDPRAQAAAFLAGRDAVRPDDVQNQAVPVLAHRLMADVKARHSGLTGEAVVREVLRTEPVPA